MARKYKYQINSKRGIIKAVERPSGTTPIRESRGAYDPKATYSKGDTVIYGGLYYTATTGQGVPGEGDGWEISGVVSAKAVTLTLKLSKPVLDVSDGAKAVTATATATLGEQDITAGLPADGWRWTWRGKELSGETKSSTTLTDIPLEVGQYPVRVTHKLFGTFAEEQVVRVDVTSKLRAELEEALEGIRQSTGDEQAAMAEILGKVNKTLTSLQEQVDKEVSNWFYPGPPSPDKEPESEWTTNQAKYRHIGDTYTSVDESGEYMGKSWRYTTEFKWQEIHDTLISKALSVAAKAQTTADGKSTTYYTQPAHYSVGDSWVLSADTTVGGKRYKKGTMLFASASSEVFVGAHWGERLKYIDSAKLEADLKASEAKSKQAWEAYAAAKASKAGEDALKAAKEYAEAQDAAHEERTKAYADKILTEKEQALIAVADAKAALAEKRAKAYADGKITDTEQLAIDKAAAAYKAAIAKAKELDGEIQVGGRNLLRGTDYSVIDRLDRRYWSQDLPINHDDTYAYVVYGYAWNYKYKTIHLEPGTYTLSVMAKSHEQGKSGELRVDTDLWQYGKTFGVTTDEWQRYSLTFDVTEPYDGILRLLESGHRETLIRFAHVKLERGTVATDWTPAPEDIQAEIDAAKEQATRAQTSTESLRGYVEGAYKDGIITEVESKAIKTYINEVEAMWSSAFGAYERVYVNPLLTGTPKTALADAKITLAGAKDNLVGQIKSAISDGRATAAEAAETERLYNVYKSALRDFQKALKSAEEAIRDAGKTTGGRNLILESDTAFSNTDYRVAQYYIADPSQMVAGETYTIRIWGEAEGTDFSESLWVYNSGGNTEVANIQHMTNGAWTQTLKWIDDRDKSNRYLNIFRGANHPSYNKGSKTTITRVKLERGTVATDWTPAPEDVQSEIDAAKEQATKAQTSTDKLRGYVDGAFRDGVVDGAEAKAIKTYINEVDAQWQSALGAYEKVYTNSLLTGAPKTALLDCKTTLAGKCDDLTQYIATAIGDGRATPAEVDGVNTRYNAYKTALRDFQKALKEAEEAIRKKSGGAKFLGEATSLGFDGGVQLESGQFVYGKAGDTVRMTNTGSNNVTSWEKDKVYILVLTTDKGYELLVWVSLTGAPGRDGKDGAPGRDGKDGAPGRDGRDGVDGKDGVGADYSKEVKELQDGLASANTAIDTLNNCRQMLKDNKITLDKLPDSLRWIYKAFNEGETIKEGGLLLSQIIGLSNIDGKITAYFSGRNAKGAHMLAAGVTSLADQDAVSYINYDGTAKFGGVKINRDSIYIDADDSGSGVHQVVHDRLYITRSGIFAYLDRYIAGGIGEGIFKANYEQGFHSKRVSIGDGGTSIIQAPRGNTMGLQIQGNLHVFGDKLEYNNQRILYEEKPRMHSMTESGGYVMLRQDDSLVLIGDEALSGDHCTIELPDPSDVQVGWRCKVTTMGAVSTGNITFKTKYSSQKMFWGSEPQVSSSHNYAEKTNVIVALRIPRQFTNNGTAYWFVKEIRAY